MDAIISVKDLSKSYQEIKAVQDISFSIKRGEFFSFLGVNGAGKTTTISILAGLLKKDVGSVSIDGLDIEKNGDQIKKKIGIVFQNSVLDESLSIKENLFSRGALYGISKRDIHQRIIELSQLLNLGNLLKRQVKTLSGGQKRRVDIARALIHQPAILFLDEPTTGLDPQNRQIVWEILSQLRLKQHLTIFLTTHYMEETENSDHVIIIDEGRIVAEGTPRDLKNKFTHNYLYIHHSEDVAINNALLSSHLPYEYLGDHYRVTFFDSQSVTNFIIQYHDLFLDYEVVRGNMDDVFLQVTGKKLEH